MYWWSLGLAITLHLALLLLLATVFSPHGASVPEPAKVKFFTRRDPTLSKPIKIQKVPQPKRQLVRTQVQPTTARMDQVRATAAFDSRSLVSTQTPNLALPSPTGLATDIPQRGQEAAPPRLGLPGVSQVARAPEQRIDLSLEMMDINSMDIGRYRAMVVQDGRDRQQIKGFVKVASVVPVHVKNSPQVATGMGGAGEQKMLQLLCEALNSYTGLQAEFVGDFTYDDTRILEVPIICRPLDGQNSTDRNILPNEAEVQNIANYLLAGGFFLGALQPQLLQGLEKYCGLVRGRDFWEARLPDDHPIYTAFFDILGGVPSGNYPGRNTKWDGPYALIGQFLKGRLISVYAPQGFGWDNYRHFGDTTRQMQMAVNIVIYALTQEGSMTQRLMQMVN